MSPGKIVRLAAIALCLSSYAATSHAEQTSTTLGVVELFTSQGCSSCPPADALFTELAKQDNIVALSYHVDYWDYLGWRDSLGSKENTERQYGYMRSFANRSVYTPQAVINGRTHVNGANRSAINGKLASLEQADEGMRVDIKVSQHDDGVMIEAGDGKLNAHGKLDRAHVIIVYFDVPQTVQIGRGENGGREVTYWNAVNSIQTAGMWHGKAQSYELPASEISKKGGCAVLLQSVDKNGLPGPILGAAFVKKPATR